LIPFHPRTLLEIPLMRLANFFRLPARRPFRHLASTALRLEQLEDRTVPTTFSVLNLLDSGAGSLRQAITSANAHAGPDTIQFNVAGTIKLTSAALPVVTDNVNLDGSTAPGFATKPVVMVDFNRFDGLRFAAGAAGSSLKSLSLVNAIGAGVTVTGGGSMLIVGNFIGVGLSGASIGANRGNGLELNATSRNTVGGTTALERNIISANLKNGILISGSSRNSILGNYLGTDSTGTLNRGNQANGIQVTAGAGWNIIGTQAGNVISGNQTNGVLIDGQAAQTTIAGNLIGLANGGTVPLGNRRDGVRIDHSNLNLIGRLDPALGFQLSNVISANGGSGVALVAANDNRVAMNFIGTDLTGAFDQGNSGNGILVTAFSQRNTLGGSASGGNDPTGGIFVRPPQGNLISGNNANGVLITDRSTQTVLSGNFVGTSAGGNSPLGNALDGVAIVGANSNALIGCLVNDNPFIYYNVVSGNGGNGLRVANSDGTTIQANFFGLGADNDTPVGNRLSGVVIEGSSTRTLMGGQIPLGNVDAANGQNGLVIRDQAKGFVSFNTFCGLAAFTLATDLGNGGTGMLITSTGGGIEIRTNVISNNKGNGVEIAGDAQGVQFVSNIVGLNTNGSSPMGNLGDGIRVGGNAHDIVIGGPLTSFSVIPHNVVSASGRNGVAIVENAHGITLNNTFLGTNLEGTTAFGNAQAGVLLDAGTHSNTVGSENPNFLTVISGNLGHGVEMRSTFGNTVVGSLIGTNFDGLQAIPNGGSGVYLSDSNDNLIGRVTNGAPVGPANLIAFNNAGGVTIDSGARNGVRENSIYGNSLHDLDLGPWANLNPPIPVLTAVARLALGTQVTGNLAALPNTTYTIEFFANNANASSGQIFFGSKTITTDAVGNASFVFTGPLLPAGADFFTATATDLDDNTSEFSAVFATAT
jgi:hypothetical protein